LQYFFKPQRLKWNVLVFRVLFSRIFFKPQRLKYFVTCFPCIIFLYLFKSQRLKYFVTCVMLSNIFPYFFKNKFIFVTESIFYKFYILSISTTKCTNTTACYDPWYISPFLIWYYVVKHFPSFIKSSLNNWCPIKMFIVLHVWILLTWHRQQ
jgi:hypothetical protein